MESLRVLLFVACVGVYLSGVSSQPNRFIQGRIIGGYDVPSYLITYQVSIRNAKNNHHICSGAVLAERWVITSARCVYDVSISDLQVFYGSRSLSGYGKTIKVTQVFKHKRFDAIFYENDLAMLYTATKIKFERNVVDKIRLPAKESVENEIAMVTGFGVTSVSLFFLSHNFNVCINFIQILSF